MDVARGRSYSAEPSTGTIQGTISFSNLPPFHRAQPFSPYALARSSVAQVYGNCSLTNRLNPLFSLRGEDNHPPRTSQSFDPPSFVGSLCPTHPTFIPRACFRFTVWISSPRGLLAPMSGGFSTLDKRPRDPLCQRTLGFFFFGWITRRSSEEDYFLVCTPWVISFVALNTPRDNGGTEAEF